MLAEHDDEPLAFDDPHESRATAHILGRIAEHGRYWPTIQEWAVIHARRTDTPAGDFVGDLAGDGRRFNSWFGYDDPQSWDELKTYLQYRGVWSRDIFAAGREVWRRYAAWCRRHGIELEPEGAR